MSKKVVVYKFNMFKISEDPELEATERLYEWSRSPEGKYIFSRSTSQPEYHHYMDPVKGCYKFDVVAELEEKYIIEYYLRWGKFLEG